VDQDDLRSNLLRFTERAFELLPPMESPRILDIGCGTGLPTLRLAELTGGQIVGLDLDSEALETLRSRAVEQGLSDRVEVRVGALEEIPFEDCSFDLVWCEGAINELGFRESLRRWRRLLKPHGCMGLHDEAGDVDGKLSAAQEEGFALLGHFEISEQVWWDEYFALADEEMGLEAEIQRFQREPEKFRSAFFVLRWAEG
jgi:ubiquinone/menaquinone biosynthesis C-methylase UbiE